MKCKKCGADMPDGYDCGCGKYTGAEEGLCIKCFSKRMDRLCDLIHNSEDGPLTAVLAFQTSSLSPERENEVVEGAKLTTEEQSFVIGKAVESGYLDKVSSYALEVLK